VLPHSGDNFAIPHDSDPLSDNILPTLGGYLYVHLPSISLVGGGHVDVSAPGVEVVDFGLSLLHNPIELVDAVVSLLEVLVGGGCPLVYSGDEAIGHGACGGLKVITLVYAKDHFSCAG